MNKAFIFDMDGVIINSEPVWARYEEKFVPKLFGKNIYSKMKDQILGSTINKIYELACGYGLKMNKNKFVQVYDSYARIIYQEAKITKGIEALIDKLISLNFKLALVSSSRQFWIDMVLSKMKKTADKFDYVLSLNDEGITTKPSPDGYLKAIEKLGSKPGLTIILEDSQRGVDSAKASGAFTICLKEYLPKNYLPQGADMYVETIDELIEKVPKL